MELEPIGKGMRPGPSRLRTIAAIVACTVLPTLLLVAALRASPEPLILPLIVVLTVCLVRGSTVAARWFALGPGRPSDRTIWGIFVVAMLSLAPFAALIDFELSVVALLIPYFVMQSIYWRAAGFFGEREVSDETGIKSRLGIQDALVALALFCVVVAGIRTWVELRDFRSSPHAAMFFLLGCAVLIVVGLIPFFCDLGMRAAIRARSSRDRRIGTRIVALPTILAIVSLLVVCIAGWRNEYIVTTLGFAAAYFVYSALQESVLAASGIVATVDST
jgi:hypothetical protein